jgi:DNA-binding NtrC family response regulator
MGARILLVDDEPLLRRSLSTLLADAGYEVDQAETAGEALAQLGLSLPDLVLLDYRLPDRSGLEVLRRARRMAPRLPVLMMTAHGTIGGAVEAMREGAYDYLEKPFEVDELLPAVERGLETARLREEVFRNRAESLRGAGLENLVAESPAMREIVQMVRRIATSEATTILLTGESGVGKGLIARALHAEGSSRERPFLTITCTALAAELLESELFGHERGAFTDAKSQKKGLFELGDGGTIFLDEIGDLPMSLQGKLLRVLEDKTFRRVGGTHDIRVSVRIIAATNKELQQALDEGAFRRDLYYRLKVIPIEVPPLRDRREDVPILVERFVRHFCGEFHRSISGIDPAALELLVGYPWPGNVRELRNAIERAVLLTANTTLGVEDLPTEIRGGSERGLAASEGLSRGFQLPAEGVVFEELERDLVRQALAITRGNRSRAARLLGMNRDQIRYRIEKFGLETDESQLVAETG